MLESKTLSRTPVPDVASLSAGDKRRFLRLVDNRLVAEGSQKELLNREIDALVSDAYGLTRAERRAIGIE